MNYIVGQIKGRQYVIKPNEVVEVDKINEQKFLMDKILMIVDGEKIELGHPYLDKKVEMDVVGQKKDKIRVFFYKPKANHHKTRGQKIEKSLVKIAVDKLDKVEKKSL